MKGHETFSETILRHRGLLFSVCRRYSRDGMEVDDLLQETTMRLWTNRDKLFSITSPPKRAVWIWRVARNTCISLMRHTPPPSPLPEGYDPPDEDPTLHETLHELIAQLPEPDRTIVTMHIEGYDPSEIGQKTGMTRNNVGIRLKRIKDKLRKLWEEQI